MMYDPEAEFVTSARQHGMSTRHGGSEETNEAYRNLVVALKELRKRPDKGANFLLSLLNDDDLSVVTWSALYLLPIQETEALAALEKVARSGTRLTALEADLTLKEWREGRLKVD